MLQRTAEWDAARVGRITASRLGDLMARTKSGYGASRENYIAELVLERLTGNRMPKFQSRAMEIGVEREAEARDFYSFMRGVEVQAAPFVPHPTVAMTGASPDGRVCADGLVEIKCPQPAQHLRTLLGESIARGYILQMQWQMDCEQRDWCDWISYSPDFPQHLSMVVRRVPRDANLIDEIRVEVEKANAEIAEKLAALDEAVPGLDDLSTGIQREAS